MASLGIVFLGDSSRPEYRAARLDLARFGTVSEFADAASAEAALAQGALAPDAIVVAQAYPGEFSRRAIERLRRQAPLARVIGLMGTWCEGEMRSGSPWPAEARLYWHQWPTRGPRELARLASGKSSTWALPPTAADEERVLAELAEGIPRGHGGPVVVRSTSYEMAEWLAAVCRAAGYLSVKFGERNENHQANCGGEGARDAVFNPLYSFAPPCVAAIFDGSAFGELERGVAALRPAPVVALLSFPRIEDRERAIALGAAAVVSKPTTVNDLAGTLGEVLEEASSPGSSWP